MKEYVSVDVETTGLAPKQDKIIEIGAVRVRDGQIVGSFTSFVNPGRILPAHITELTGILQEQVDEAETMESILPAFLEFAGDLPLVGHRILFDYGFLKRAAVNMRLDFERSGVDTEAFQTVFVGASEQKIIRPVRTFRNSDSGASGAGGREGNAYFI